MSGTVTKADVERELDGAWQALELAVDDLSGLEMEQAGVVDGWSAKDLLGHIAFWDQEAARNLDLIANGKAQEIVWPGSPEAIDEWNEREWRKRRPWPLARVRKEWQESHRKVEQALARLPEGKFDLDLGGRSALDLFASDTYDHYREHIQDILAWRRELETSET